MRRDILGDRATQSTTPDTIDYEAFQQADCPKGPPGGEDPYEMDPRRQPGRTPSPGQPLRGYQLEDRYASPAPQPGILEIPMGPAASGDRLPLQPSVRVCALSHRTMRQSGSLRGHRKMPGRDDLG
jgi:hypothetical protein